MGKESACNSGDMGDVGSIPGSGRSPGGGKWQLTPVFLPKISHGQRTLLGYRPKGHKESDMTDYTCTHIYALYMHICVDIHVYIYMYVYMCVCVFIYIVKSLLNILGTKHTES